MSTNKSGMLGKAEWLTSVDVALNGAFGTCVIAIVYEIGLMIFNPEHIANLGLIQINEHFVTALFIVPFAILFYAAICLWRPVRLGLQETEANLYFLNLKKTVNKVEEALNTEEGRVAILSLIEKEVKKNTALTQPVPGPAVDRPPIVVDASTDAANNIGPISASTPPPVARTEEYELHRQDD